MKLRLTLDRPQRPPVDVAVTFDATATVHDLAEFLSVADPTSKDQAGEVPEDLTLGIGGGARLRALDPAAVVGESGLRSGQTVTLTRTGQRFVEERSKPVASLRVVAGPDEGREFPLVAGSNIVGRGRGCEVRLTDPMVSRRHVRLNLGEGPEVMDLGSANGITVNDAPAVREQLQTGDRVQAGDTVFTIRMLSVASAEGRAEGIAVPFIKSPRLVRVFGGRTFEAPEPPERPGPVRFPRSALVAPLLMGALMYVVTRSPASLVFVALSPMMMIGQWIENRFATKSTSKAQLKLFRFDVDSLAHDIAEANKVEHTSRLLEHPSVTECAQAIHDLSPLFWTRRTDSPGFCEFRVGTGTVPHRSEIEFPSAKRAPRDIFASMVRVLAPLRVIHDAPVVVTPPDSGGVGVAGPREAAASVARALMLQAAALHTPEDLVVAAVASARTAEDWDWLKWLPHCESPWSPLEAPHLASSDAGGSALIAEIEETLKDRAAEEGSKGLKTPGILLLVESDAPVDFGRLVALAEHGWAQGIYVLWVAPDVAQLPSACRTFVDTKHTPQGDVGFVRTGEVASPVKLEGLGLEDARASARRMAPVEDIAARTEDSSDLPRTVSWLNLVGTGLGDDPNTVVERWLENRSIFHGRFAPDPLPRKPAKLRGVLGANASGLHALDLRADGPHALVGGTTGAGKSELLQTWILGMAATNSPERLTFLLVDYKGGSAFAECNNLPHTVGLVTDLNTNGVRRALTSLAAELRYREEVLHHYAAKDLVTLEKTNPAAAPPSLVIVVDEFAALVQEVPEFVDGVVNVAQRGRSLGLHLILATQRPSGVIKGNLRANTNLRVALRVADVDDSNDVLGVPHAAYFDQDTPGRAISKTGPGRFVTFQTGYVGGHTGQAVAKADVAAHELGFASNVPWEKPVVAEEPTKDLGPNDIAKIVDTIIAADALAEIPAPRKPWLPELLPYYSLAALPTRRRDDELVFAISDDAESQSQPTVAFHPDVEGNMAIFGTGGSGKSAVLRSLAIAAGFTVRGGPCHVYGLDFGSRGLAMLEGLPHVGSVIVGSDEERVQRLVSWLRTTVDERAARYSAVNASTITEYRTLAGRPDEPRILVLIDGLAAFRSAYEATTMAWIFDTMVAVASDGRPVGVHIVLTADRINAMPTALASAVQSRLVLRLADANDYSFLNVPSDIVGPDSPPGRGIYAGREIQVAILGKSPDTLVEQGVVPAGTPVDRETLVTHLPRLADASAQAEAMRGFRQSMERAGVRRALEIRKLPDEVAPAELPATLDGRPVLGIRGADLGPWSFDPTGTFIVTGPPGSGRTTAVRAVVQSLRRQSREWNTVLLTPRRTGIGQHIAFDHTAQGIEQVTELATKLSADLKELEARGGTGSLKLVIVIEAINELANTPADAALGELVARAVSNNLFVVAEGEVSTLGSNFGLLAAVKTSRRGLALQPDTGDGTLVYRTDFPPRLKRATFPPGRGFLVALGKTDLGQVMLPDQG